MPSHLDPEIVSPPTALAWLLLQWFLPIQAFRQRTTNVLCLARCHVGLTSSAPVHWLNTAQPPRQRLADTEYPWKKPLPESCYMKWTKNFQSHICFDHADKRWKNLVSFRDEFFGVKCRFLVCQRWLMVMVPCFVTNDYMESRMHQRHNDDRLRTSEDGPTERESGLHSLQAGSSKISWYEFRCHQNWESFTVNGREPWTNKDQIRDTTDMAHHDVVLWWSLCITINFWIDELLCKKVRAKTRIGVSAHIFDDTSYYIYLTKEGFTSFVLSPKFRREHTSIDAFDVFIPGLSLSVTAGMDRFPSSTSCYPRTLQCHAVHLPKNGTTDFVHPRLKYRYFKLHNKRG